MTNTENINIKTEDAMDVVKQVAEAIPAATNSKFNTVLGAGAVFTGVAVVIGGAVWGIRHLSRKKKLKDEQEKAAASGVDNVQVAKDDFEENDSTEE